MITRRLAAAAVALALAAPLAGCSDTLVVTKKYKRADGALCVEARAAANDHFRRRCIARDIPDDVAWWRRQAVGAPLETA